MLDFEEKQVARSILRESELFYNLKQHNPDRYLYLEQQLGLISFSYSSVYGSKTKDQLRNELAAQITIEIEEVPPKRLLTLLGQALKWQHHLGLLPEDASFNLFSGTVASIDDKIDLFPTKTFANLESNVKCVQFSPDGTFFVAGEESGRLSVWNHFTGKLRHDLVYQNENKFMNMDNAVLALAFNKKSDALLSGCLGGDLMVWKLDTGQLLRHIPKAHQGSIYSVSFSNDGFNLLSAGQKIIRIHGLRSGKQTREFRGHTSFVNGACYTPDGSRILSVGSEGAFMIWDVKTGNCLDVVRFGDSPLASIEPVPKAPNKFLLCSKSKILLIDNIGCVMAEISKDVDFLACCASPRGQFMYGLGSDGVLYCYEGSTLVNEMQVMKDGVFVACHPLSNVVAVGNMSGTVKLLKP